MRFFYFVQFVIGIFEIQEKIRIKLIVSEIYQYDISIT